MKTNTVTVHQAKTNLSKLLQKAASGEQVVIARGAKPVARLVTLGEVKGKRVPGALPPTSPRGHRCYRSPLITRSAQGSSPAAIGIRLTACSSCRHKRI
jgi:prevent-host-death family protein